MNVCSTCDGRGGGCPDCDPRYDSRMDDIHEHGMSSVYSNRPMPSVPTLDQSLSPRISVDADALREVLQALIGAPHRIRELQATQMLPGNPITKLIEQYNTAVRS